MRLRLSKLQKSNKKSLKLKVVEKLLRAQKNLNKLLYHYSLSYILKIISSNLINQYHNHSLISHVKVNKTKKLIS